MGERQKFSAEDKREIGTMAVSLGRPGFLGLWRGIRECPADPPACGREGEHEGRSRDRNLRCDRCLVLCMLEGLECRGDSQLIRP